MRPTHCLTCGYLFDVPHNLLCAEVKGLREQVRELRDAYDAARPPALNTEEPNPLNGKEQGK